MSVISSIGSELRNLLTPVSKGSDTISPNTQATAKAELQKALMKAIQNSTTTTKSTKSSSGKDSSTDKTSGDSLGKDEFLQLLVQQMQYQDPLEPTDNAQMIAQLAQFSSLEQMNNLNQSFDTLSGNIDQLNFITGTSMIGRTVSGINMDGDVVTGTVTGVTMKGSVVYLTVGNNTMSMAGVQSIK